MVCMLYVSLQINNFWRKPTSSPPHHHILLRTTEEKSNKEIATKLHRSFAHPCIDKLLALIKNSGKNSGQKTTTYKEKLEMSQKTAQCVQSINSPDCVQ